ncbi:MAG: hypothetical protein WAQ05_01435 [Rubrivivax sp.]
MRILPSTACKLALAAALLAGSVAASARADVSVGINLGFPIGAAVPLLSGGAVFGQHRYWTHGGAWHHRSWGPRYMVVGAPLGYYYYDQPPVALAPPPEPAPRSVPATRPDPVIYPRNGQNSQQTEYDRQECNRWATTQPQAVADASVFQRAVEACMDGRGYTMK